MYNIRVVYVVLGFDLVSLSMTICQIPLSLRRCCLKFCPQGHAFTLCGTANVAMTETPNMEILARFAVDEF